MHSAGILPVIFENDKTYVLLGEEYQGWSGFSGRQDGDETPQETAFREFHEETVGIFPEVDIKFLHKNCLHFYNTITPSKKMFVMYIVDFSSIFTQDTSVKFNEALKRTNNKCEMEKTSIQWVEISNITKRKLRYTFHKDINALIKIIKDCKENTLIDNLQIK